MREELEEEFKADLEEALSLMGGVIEGLPTYTGKQLEEAALACERTVVICNDDFEEAELNLYASATGVLINIAMYNALRREQELRVLLSTMPGCRFCGADSLIKR